MIGTSGRAVAGAALAVALGLGGCAQENGTATGAGQGQSIQPAPPSVLPAPSAFAITRERSPSGAQEFAKYWFEALNYATQTGDIAPLRQASDPNCSACLDAIAAIRNSYSDGGFLQGGTYTVRVARAEEFGLEDRPLVAVSFDRSSRSGFAPDGQVRDTVPAASFVNCQLTLVWTGSKWRTSVVTGELVPA